MLRGILYIRVNEAIVHLPKLLLNFFNKGKLLVSWVWPNKQIRKEIHDEVNCCWIFESVKIVFFNRTTLLVQVIFPCNCNWMYFFYKNINMVFQKGFLMSSLIPTFLHLVCILQMKDIVSIHFHPTKVLSCRLQ